MSEPSASNAATPTTTARPPRSLAPDLARGLMLAFIALANVSWFLWGQPGTGSTAHVPPRGVSDTVLQFVMSIAVDGRSYPLFAFLFGYGMVQFYRSRIDRGLEPPTVRRMLRRRHWVMILLGLAHAALLFMGDILGAYGLAALLLVWIFFECRDRTLTVWVSILIGLIAIGALLSMVSGMLLSTAPAAVLDAQEQGIVSIAEIRDATAGEQDYLLSVVGRLDAWVFVMLGQMFLLVVPVAILLGWLAARYRLLDEPWNHVRLLRRTAVAGIAVGWIGALPQALTVIGAIPLHDALFWTFLGLTHLTGLAGGLGYAALFGLIATTLEGRSRANAPANSPARTAVPRPIAPTTAAERSYGVPAAPTAPPPTTTPGPVVRAVAAVGQRSLTFYLFQSVIFAPLLSAWGLGLGQYLSTTSALAIALLVWLVSLPLAAALASRGRRGPAEALLRRLTYGRDDPQPRTARSA